jgi:O-antigen/teichoic acid export membrane protein
MTPRTLTGNVVLNFAGQAVPFAAVAACMPVLARALGLERLGLLGLAWVLIGSFGLLDLGMGRALTQTVSAALATDRRQSVRTLLVTGTALLFAVGMAGAMTLCTIGSWLVEHYFRISPDLRHEALAAIYFVAGGVPFMLASSSQRGFLEAHQRFDLVNLVRAPVGALNYAGPVAVLPFSHSVAVCVAVIVITRIAAFVAYGVMCWSMLPRERATHRFEFREIVQFVQTGGWMTTANLAGAALAYADRFILTGAVSVTALAYYATPQEILTKLTVIPMTAGAVVFPAFSAAAAVGSDRGTRLFEKMSLGTFAALLPICLTASALTPYWLTLWMGRDFAMHSSAIAQLFCYGTFMNSMAVTPALFLQGSGRSDLAAKLQLIQLPLYVVCLWLAAARFGLLGVTIVWCTRMSVDAVMMYIGSRSLLTRASTILRRHFRLVLLGTIGFLATWWSPAVPMRLAGLALSAVWFALELPTLFPEDDRAYALALWKRARAIIIG